MGGGEAAPESRQVGVVEDDALGEWSGLRPPPQPLDGAGRWLRAAPGRAPGGRAGGQELPSRGGWNFVAPRRRQ